MNWVNRTCVAVAGAALLSGLSGVQARAAGPYTADANTLGLYHFDELPGPADPGTPIANFGSIGSTLDLTNTGGPDGRDNTGGGGYGATAPAGYGSAFHILASGNNTYHATQSGVGGGATTATPVLQSSLQGANGAFTYEALINLASSTTPEQTILAHDGDSTRGFLFRVINSQLSFYTGFATGTTTYAANIPTTGSHLFDASKWYHVAVTYDGNEGAADNLRFYWTALDAGATEANLIGTGSLPADLTGAVSNLLGVGTTTRSPFRFEAELIDEVRISSVARGPSEFSVPEPTTLGTLLVAGVMMLNRRRRA